MRLRFLFRRSGRRSFERIGRELPLQISFDKFHQLLGHNNRVLELIAEMEEMLHGEYLFDKSNLSKVCQELSFAISRVVYNLNLMGRGKYLELFEISENIARHVEAELSEEPLTPEVGYVVHLGHLHRGMSNFSGGKGASLGELRSKLKVLTPPGFVITTRAYNRFLETNDLSSEIEKCFELLTQSKEPPLEEVSRRIERMIEEAAVPADVVKEIEHALDTLASDWRGKEMRYAVRSSALGEDTQLSFAGQYSTFLNVTRAEVIPHYKKVVASLFGSNALAYRKRRNVLHFQTPMAVVVMPMLNPVCSGVMYSVDPNSPASNSLVISAVWGLGQMAAEGEGESDYFILSRTKPHKVVQQSVARKSEAFRARGGGGVTKAPVSSGRQREACLSDDLKARLAELALRIESYFEQPQDIEWAVHEDGTVYVLQARPLLISDEQPPGASGPSNFKGSYPVFLEGKGVVACRGVGAGRVHHVFPSDSGSDFPQGAVLLARTTSPRLSSLIAQASAVVTDIGTPTGHMATIAREFQVPMIVDTGDATRFIPHGAEITVDANNKVIYGGIVKELLRSPLFRSDPFHGSLEFCKLRNILKHVAPLHLVDPQKKEQFRALNCQSYHDIIRFSHEMIIRELIDMHLIRKRYKQASAKRLSCPLPIGLILIDVGNGLREDFKGTAAEIEDITCAPLRTILAGLLEPGVWETRPVPLTFRDFLSGVGHTGDPTVSQPEYGSRSLAIISNYYLNLSLRFGYHFNMVDCVASERRSANYIYFRFVGGITEMARRRRRARFLTDILSSYDFAVETKGDLVIARIAKINLDMMEDRLRMIGRLIGFSRQLDVFLRSDETVDFYARKFLTGGNNGGMENGSI